ncbi:hypothetical protein [Paracoccus pantotrophus]|nr:hypothetical protein [Paracoccus pantotrophus]MDF3853772.1 hypothetical protein [Paracoccus pantotrophus]SFO50094.1 cytochrome o ubiquinol oxidase subunit 2 [Paracoccus pantotrophus]
MFGQSPELARAPLDTAPLRGHALVPPKGPFAPSQDNAVTLLDPAEGRARNF